MAQSKSIQPTYELSLKLMLKSSDYATSGDIKRHFRMANRLKAQKAYIYWPRYWQWDKL